MAKPIQTKPQYRDSHPKIDLYRADGTYVGSTNHWRTCRDAVAYYQSQKPEMGVAKARIDRSA